MDKNGLADDKAVYSECMGSRKSQNSFYIFFSGMFFLITVLIIFLVLLGFLLYEVLTPGTRFRDFLCRTGSSHGQPEMICEYASAYEVWCQLQLKHI